MFTNCELSDGVKHVLFGGNLFENVYTKIDVFEKFLRSNFKTKLVTCKEIGFSHIIVLMNLVFVRSVSY